MEGIVYNTDYGWMVKHSNPCCYEMFERYIPLDCDTDKKYLLNGNIVEFKTVTIGIDEIAVPTKLIKKNELWM